MSTSADGLRVAVFVLPLGFDTFAMAVLLGLRGLNPLQPAVIFSLFEMTMPVIGIVVGRYVGFRIGTLAVDAGAIVLIGIGVHLLFETLHGDNEAKSMSFGSVKGTSLVAMGVSMDELAMGFPLGALGLPIAAVLAAIGVQAFLVTAGGILLGRRVSAAAGQVTSRTASTAAGFAFIVLGAYLLSERFVLHVR